MSSTNYAPLIQILWFNSYVLSKIVPHLEGRRGLIRRAPALWVSKSQASDNKGKWLFCKQTREMGTGQIP